MKIWVDALNLEHAKDLLSNPNVDFVVVGLNNEMSTRISSLLSLDEIKDLICSKLVVSLNNLYEEKQIDLLETTLKQLKSLKVKTIIFSDFAVKQICDEINYKCYLVYASETLATNYGQLEFYYENNINEVQLSRELNFYEIKDIAANKKNVKIQLQAEGYNLIMHSKWKLLTNFAKQFKIKKDLSNQLFYLKEETRDLPNLIYEDNTGSHLFSGYNISILEYLDKLKNANVDSLHIFSLFHSKSWVDKTIEVYSLALKDKKLFSNIKTYVNELKQINEISACGFLDPTKGLLHLDRKVENNE